CTLHYDAARGAIRVMRVKEDADDYRYFPDPDLIPLVLDEAMIEAARAALPELPEVRRARFVSAYGLAEYDAGLLAESRALADFYEQAVAVAGAPRAKAVANWVMRDVLQALGERGVEIDATRLTPEALAALVGLVEDGRVTA